MSPSGEEMKPQYVRDLMTVGVVTCGFHTSIITIAQAILEKDIEAVVVLDSEGHAHGIVGQDELVNAYAKGDYHQLTAQDIMTEGIPQFPPDIPLDAAAQLMQDQNLRVFFLTHHAGGIEYPAGVISYKHFLRHLAMKTDQEIKDLGIGAERKGPLEAFIERREALKSERNKNTHLE